MTRKFNGSRDEMMGQLPKRQVGAEVGVLRGGFSAAILAFAKPKHLTLIDLWKHQDQVVYDDLVNVSDKSQEGTYRYVLRRFKKEIARKQVTVRRGYSAAIMETMPADSLDWLYLDANHSFECVLEDLTAARRIVKPDGIIMGHDYCEKDDGVHHLGVIQAVAEFLESQPGLELALITDEEWPSYLLAMEGWNLWGSTSNTSSGISTG